MSQIRGDKSTGQLASRREGAEPLGASTRGCLSLAASPARVRIRAELIDRLYKQTPIGMVATLVNSPILAFVLWDLVAHRRLLLWLGVTVAVTIFRYGLVWAHRSNAFKETRPALWAQFQVAALAISGLLWGSAALYLFPAQSTAHQAFLAFVLAGMVAGAVGICSSVFGAFLAFSLPALGPILTRFFLIGDNLHTAMGVMTCLFLVLTSLTAWRINIAAVELVTLKESFAERVAEQTAELLRANDELKSEIVDRKRAQEHLRASLQEKEVLLKEIHHRVKNNLAVIISLLKMQSARIADPSGKEALQDCHERVEAIALIHETLYQSGDLAAIPLADYARSLSGNLMQMMLAKEEQSRIGVVIEAAGVHLPVDAAVPCGLILNELLTNAFKYAFTPGKGGQIQIAARINAGTFELLFRDDGIGFPPGLVVSECNTLGFRIISVLVQHQMEGTWEAKNENGASITIRWPCPRKEALDDSMPT